MVRKEHSAKLQGSRSLATGTQETASAWADPQQCRVRQGHFATVVRLPSFAAVVQQPALSYAALGELSGGVVIGGTRVSPKQDP